MVTISNVSFTNEFGNVIQPGDTVIVVAERYKSVSIKQGRFIGMNGRRAVVEVKSRRLVWDDSSYKKYHYEDYMRRSHLFRNRIYPASTPLSSFVDKGF
jgi:hypothetical protein